MSRKRWVWLLLLALAAGGAGVAWQQRAKTLAQAEAATAAAGGTATGALEFMASDVAVVAPQPMTRTIPLTGTLRPVNQTLVKSKVAGELREVLVREGMAVRRGQPVARIDTTEYEWRVKEREGQLKSAASQVDQAQRTLENTRQLHEKGFVSRSALDGAQSGWEVAVGNRDAATAQLTLARKTLADAVMTAPMDGTVAERFAQPGEKVAVDGRILSIIDLSRMEIEAPVPASQIASVKVGQPVELRIEGVAEPQVGHIARVSPSTQAGTRSVPVYIALDNRDPSVRAGLFAQGSLAVETRENVLTVPVSAVRDAGARTFVYAIADGKLIERDVRLGLRDESAPSAGGGTGVVEVVAGLEAGMQVVVANLGALRAGAPARVVAAAPVRQP
jgi:RND family efflux transporter MFP subunit